jgi:hypothetical protein
LINPPKGDQLTPLAPFPINSSNEWNKTIYEGTATYKFSDEKHGAAPFAGGSAVCFSNRGNDPAFLSFGPEKPMRTRSAQERVLRSSRSST